MPRKYVPTKFQIIQGNPKIKKDIYFNRMSWGFIGLAIGSLTAYLVVP